MADWRVAVTPSTEGACVLKVSSVKDAQVFSTPISFVNGVASPTWCAQARHDRLKQIVKFRTSDVVVSTYPKCGTTWMEQIVLLLLVGGDESKLDPIHKNSYRPNANQIVGKIWPEACLEQSENAPRGAEFQPMTLETFDSAPTPRLIKTHASVELLLGGNGSDGQPPLNGAKVIYVTRNPKDACVSSYHHGFNPFKSGWAFEAWTAAFLSGNIIFGSWFENTKGWVELHRKYPEQVLIVHFEELKRDTPQQVARIAAHLGIPADVELLDRVMEKSAFDSMKGEAEKKAQNSLNSAEHMRKGEIGDWRNYFSPELAAEFDAAFHKQMEGIGMTWDCGLGEVLTA